MEDKKPRNPFKDWQDTDPLRAYATGRPGVHTAYKDYSVPERRVSVWPWLAPLLAAVLIVAAWVVVVVV